MPVRAPPAFGKAALAVVVVAVRTASRVAISTPSNVLLVVTGPVKAPPALGKAAFAVVVVEVKTPSRVAISTPSTVPDTATFANVALRLLSTMAVPPML